MPDQVTVFAPATVGNVGVGFDILGHALMGAGDLITVRRLDKPQVRVGAILHSPVALPTDPTKNTATAGLLRLIQDQRLDFGFEVDLHKGLAIGSGMGGSAASAAGAIVAASALLEQPLTDQELLSYALIGEAVASGAAHADNLAPCLFGGLQLVTGQSPIRRRAIPTPPGLYCALVRPAMELPTRQARQVLRQDQPFKLITAQSARLAEFLAGCYTGDVEAIGHALGDDLVEPLRSPLIPGFYAVKEAALSHGALGCSISGAGPSVFAWCSDRPSAEVVASAMSAAFRDAAGLLADELVSPVDAPGARQVDAP